MQYISYEEYSEMGGICSKAVFDRNITRVSGIINNNTSCRVEKMKSVPQEIKALCRDLIEYLDSNMHNKNISSKSQSAGNVSESESYAVKSNEQQMSDIDEMICDYLLSVKDDNGTPLLYRGCSVD